MWHFLYHLLIMKQTHYLVNVLFQIIIDQSRVVNRIRSLLAADRFASKVAAEKLSKVRYHQSL